MQALDADGKVGHREVQCTPSVMPQLQGLSISQLTHQYVRSVLGRGDTGEVNGELVALRAFNPKEQGALDQPGIGWRSP